nr:uncharacterized protein LOC131799867 [Pocillopora verrucosa]
MSQIITRKVFTYSSASTQHPIEITGEEGTILKPETFPSSYEAAVAESPHSEIDQGGGIAFKIRGSKDANPAYTKQSSTKIVRTFVTNEEEKKQLANEAALPNTEQSLAILQENIQTTNRHSTTAANEDPGKHTNVDSTNITATSRRRSKTSYTYRVHDGIAVLENVTRYQPETQTITNFAREKPKHTEISNVSFEINTEDLATNQDHDVQKQNTFRTNLAFQSKPKTIFTQMDMVSKSENRAVREISAQNSSQGERQLIDTPQDTQKSPTYSYSVTSPGPSHKIFGSEVYGEKSITQPQHQKERLPSTNTKQITTQHQTTNISDSGKLIIPNFTQYTSTNQVKLCEPTPKDNNVKSDEKWRTQVVTNEEFRSEPTLQANRLSEDKMKFLHNQNTQPEKYLDKSSPGRLVIPDFNQSSFTTEVKDIKPLPKVNKLKTERWATQVVTQEDVRSEQPPQANRLSADKMKFLHNQDTQPEKNLDKSSPSRLLIPDFNQSTFTTEVKETKPSPKVDKLKTEEWVTQVVTQEEIRPEPPLQANRLSADKMQFLYNQDTQPEKNLDKSSPGRLVIPDFKQSTVTTEVKDTKPSPKVEKLKAEEWVTQVLTQKEVKSEPPLQAKRLSANKMQFLHNRDTEPEKILDKSDPGRLVIPDFKQSTFTTEVKETEPSPKVNKFKIEKWVTQVITQEEVRSEPPLQANRLSADKIEFLHNQDTQPEKKLDKSSPGRLVIPDFNQSTFTSEVKQTKPSPKVDKFKTEEWLTQVVTQEEVRSEPPLQANRLSADKMQFLHNQDTQPEKYLDKSSPGRLVIPEFSQSTFTTEGKETKPSPKVNKLKTEEWVTQVVTQEEVRSEPPLHANRLSADKMQFLHNQDTQPEKKLDKSSPGRLVIPEFSQSTFTTEGKETKPSPKVNKLKTEEWVTQVVTQEEVRSEPPLLANRLSGDKMQFLHSQDTQAEEKVKKSSPGRLVIPDFNESTSTTEAKDTKPSLKVDELKSEDWVTEVVIQEEVRSEPPLQANKLSADKMQFLHNQDTHPEKTFDKLTPGKLVIPDFNQSTFTSEVKETKPSPKVDKLKTEEWLTQVVTQEEVRSEPPLQANRLSADKMQFLHNQDTQPEKYLDKSSPGRLVIPEFSQSTFTTEGKETKPSPKVYKLKTEEWVTQVVTQEEVRSEPPLHANRLSADKMQFLHNQDTQPEKTFDKSTPGKLVIPDFNQSTFTSEDKETKPSPKVDKLKAEEWVTQVVTHEEVRSEPPLQANRLSADKMQFLHNQDTHPEKTFDKSNPGKLVIPDFNQSTFTSEVKETKPSPKVNKLKTEEWVTQVVTQEEVRSEPPLLANRLSGDKMQFLHNQDTQAEKKFKKSSPGRLVIPDFNQSTSTTEAKDTKPSLKVDELKSEDWVTDVVIQEEVRSEPPLQSNKLSADKMQFLHNQDTHPEKTFDKSNPGKLVIPDFNQSTFTSEVKETKPSPKVDKLKTEEWITQVVTQEEVRSEPPLHANRLSADKMQFLHNQDTQPEKKLDKSSPGRLVIPEFSQSTFTTEGKEAKPSPKVNKLKTEEWVTQVVTQEDEEVRSEPPLKANRLSADKMQFLHNQDTHPEKTFDKLNPGKLVIPDFNQSTFTSEVKETKPSPKVDKLKTEEWITQVVTQEEVRSEPPPHANRLSADKMQFLHNQDTQAEKKLDKSSPGRLVIPEFCQGSFTTEGKDTKPTPKVNKLKTDEWVTQVVTQEEVRSEPPLLANRLSADKGQFLHNQDTQAEKTFDKSTPGKLVIPDFNQSTFTSEVKETKPSPKVDKHKAEEWVTQVVTQEEVKSEPPLHANRLSADKMQFLHNQDTQPEKNLDKSSPGRLVIPEFSQSTFTTEGKETKPSPKVNKLKTEEWVTQVVTQEEVRSEPPLLANRLSGDKMQFLHNQDTQVEKKFKKSSPGRLVIPDFNQSTSTTEAQDTKPSLKVDELKSEDWVTEVVIQEEVRSEPPLQSNKLSADKMQFLHNQDTHSEKMFDKSTPGKLVIPDFNQSTFTSEVKETKPSPKVDKLKAEEWVTQVVTQEEVRSEPPLQANRLSADKMQFLHNQDTHPEKTFDKSNPGKLVIPDFNQSTFTSEVKETKPSPKVNKLKTEDTSTTEAKDTKPSLKVDELKSEDWVTEVVIQEEVRSEPPLQANKLSADKMQFLHNQDTHPEKTFDKSTPGKLVIPDFNQSTFTSEVKETKPSPKVDKLKTEEWLTQVVTQEEVRSEPPLHANRLSADKMQFLHNQDTQPETKLDKSSPGRLVIPEFSQSTFTTEGKETKPSPKVNKLKTEEWVTQVVTQEEVRSEPPLLANRLSGDKKQFLHNQDTQAEKKFKKSSPGRLVIPDFNQSTSTTEAKDTKPSLKVDELKSEDWVTEVVIQEEVRSEPPLQANKLSADKMQFLHNQDTHPEKTFDKSTPGKLVIPDFNQSTFTSEVKETKPSPKVDKLKTEEWLTQVVTQEEVRSEPPLHANRLSADKMQFLHNQDTQPEKKLDKSSPGRLVIPEFSQSTFTTEGKETKPSPKVNKLKTEEWVTHVVTQEEVRSEPPLLANRLSGDQMQFLHNQDTQAEKKFKKSTPGRLLIPDFNQSTSTTEGQDTKPSPKVDKLKTEEWLTQVVTQEEVRSEPPLQANRLSADKMQFLHNQDTQPEKKLDKSSPGRLVIPEFSQSTFTTEGKETKPSPKVNKLKTEEWVTQVVTQEEEEVRSEPPLQANKLSADKMQFLHNQDTHPEKTFDKLTPGKLVIPDFNQSTFTSEVKETKPSPKVDKLKTEEWLTQVVTQEEVRSEPPLKANRLSADKMQFLHNQDTQPEKKLDKSSPGRLVIPEFSQSTFTTEGKETKPSPKVNKLKTEEWVTQVVTQEEVRSEPPLLANRLSGDQMQFFHNQDTQAEKKFKKSSPGRLVIPDFNQSTSTTEAQDTKPSLKVDELKSEDSVTEVVIQEEVRSEPPLQSNKLSADKMQFLHNQDTHPEKTFDKSTPGKLVIPDFNQSTFTSEVKETKPSPKVDKLKAEEWVTQVVTQEEVRSEPPLHANRLSADKMQFLHNQDTQPEKKLDKSSPGRLVIPEFSQSTFTTEGKETKPSPKVNKLKTEEWVTQVVTQEEVRSEPPLLANRLSGDKMQFLHNQDTQAEKKFKKSSPGRLVIPDFNQSTSTTEAQDTKPSLKVDELKSEDSVTEVVIQEEVRSEPPLQSNKLSADKMQFLHNQDTHPEKTFDKSTPGKLVIPDFNQSTFTSEVKETKPSPKVDKLKAEEWVTQVVTQEEVRSEPPLKANRLSADKMQYLHNQDTQPETKLDKSSPGRLVIPEFSQSTFTAEGKETKPSPKVNKLKIEEWVTQVVTQEEVRSEPPPLANRLSGDKVQFLHNQDTQAEKKFKKSSPGRLVIPDFNQSTSTTEAKDTKPLLKVDELKSEDWVTEVVIQEEVRSEPPLQANKLSADKMQFLHNQDTQPETKLDKSSPGRLVIPEFSQSTFTTEGKETEPSPKVNKLKTEEWVTQEVTQGEIRSEPPLLANRLSGDKMQFLHNQDTQAEKKFKKCIPGRLVIPDFNQSTSTTQAKDTKPSLKVDELKSEDWVTEVVIQEEVRSEPPLKANKLSGDKMQFLHNQDAHPEKTSDKSTPGKLVIPDFNQSTFISEIKETKPSPKVDKLKTEEWLTQVVTQEEVRSEPPLKANRLSADKMQFLHNQVTQPKKMLDKSSPGRLVIPDFNQSTFTAQVKETEPSPKVNKLKAEEWVTQVLTQEEIRSEQPLHANRLLADKMQFLRNQDTHPEKTFDKSSPGKLVIPDFNQSTFTSEVKETKPSPKVDKLKTEEWLTQVVTQEDVRSEPPLEANKLSADKIEFRHNHVTQPEKKVDKSSPGRLVIPEFSQSTFTTEGKETEPSPKVNKLKTEEWVTQLVTKEKVRSEPPLLANRLSGDKVQSLHNQDIQPEKKLEKSSPGRLVIPDFNQSTFTTEVKDNKTSLKVKKLKTEEWVTQVVTQEEVRSEPPLQANRLSADKTQFLNNQDTHRDKKLDKSSPGRLVIPTFNQSTFTTEVKETKPSPKVDKLKTEEWVTQEVTQEEIRSEPPFQANRLSAEKMQFLHNQDTQLEKKLDKSSLGRLVIPDFNGSTFTTDVKDIKVSPKVDKIKTEEWITQVLTQEEVRSEPPLQANRLSADKTQFINNQDTHHDKKLDKSSPGRLVIPTFNQSTFTTEVKETKPSSKVDKLKAEEWVTQVVTQEEVISEPPLQANRLSADKMQFLHNQDTQPEKKLDKSSPGRLVIPDFNQCNFTTEVKDIKPSKNYFIKDTHSTNGGNALSSEMVRHMKSPKNVIELQSRELPLTQKRELTDEWKVEDKGNEDWRSQAPQPLKESLEKLRSLSRTQEMHSMTGSDVLPKNSNVPLRGTDNTFFIQIQDAAFATGNYKDEQGIRHYLTELPAGKTGFVRSRETNQVLKSDRAHSSDSVVIPVEPKQVSSSSGVVIHNGENWITRANTSISPAEKERIFFHAGEARQAVKLGGVSSSGSAVIPIEIKDISSSPKVEIHDGKTWTTRQTSVKLSRDDRSFVSTGETKEVITLDGSSSSGVVIPVQISSESLTTNVKIYSGQVYTP